MKQFKDIVRSMPDMDVSQLVRTVDELRRELFQIRLKSATSHAVQAGTNMRFLRKSIARGLTFLHQKVRA
jgi:ribosomal protein L29